MTGIRPKIWLGIVAVVIVFFISAGTAYSQNPSSNSNSNKNKDKNEKREDCNCKDSKKKKSRSPRSKAKGIAMPSPISLPEVAAPEMVLASVPLPALAAKPESSKVDSYEKSIAVYPKVYISLCVGSGNVRINGWKRDEIRAFIDRGSKITFKVREREGEKSRPIWVEVLGISQSESTWVMRSGTRDRKNNRRAETGRSRGTGINVFSVSSRCLSGKNIELDVPNNASVKIESVVSETSVDTIRKIDVKNGGGSIFLSRVKNGVRAQTFGGNVTVKESGGKMNLSTTSGNIVAYRTRTNEIGDNFVARTQGGSVTLQGVGQRDVRVNSVAGTINFVGDVANYGRYNFSTSYGTINLGIPQNSSCKIEAIYGGTFISSLRVLDVKKKRYGQSNYLEGRIGEGSCNLVFKTFNGSVRIRRLISRAPKVVGMNPLQDFDTKFSSNTQFSQ